jgi:hypothetical protein
MFIRVAGSALALIVIAVAWWALGGADESQRTAPRERKVEFVAAAPTAPPVADEPNLARNEIGATESAPPTIAARYLAAHEGYRPDDPTVIDPVELGDCALELRCVDASTLGAIASRVTLFRLAAPASANWSAGDQYVTETDIPPDGGRIEALPPGQYRAIPHETVFDGEDPASFVVAGAMTSITLLVSRAPAEGATVRLVDDRGAIVSVARVRIGANSGSRMRADSRPWIVPRQLLADPGDDATHFGSGGYATSGRSNWKHIVAGPEGFSLEPLALDNLAERSRVIAEFKGNDRSTCEVHVLGRDRGAARRYLGVLVDHSRVIERVFTPDGASYRPDPSCVSIVTHALREIDHLSPDAWRDVPVELKIVDPLYAESVTKFTLRQGVPEIRLVAK